MAVAQCVSTNQKLKSANVIKMSLLQENSHFELFLAFEQNRNRITAQRKTIQIQESLVSEGFPEHASNLLS